MAVVPHRAGGAERLATSRRRPAARPRSAPSGAPHIRSSGRRLKSRKARLPSGPVRLLALGGTGRVRPYQTKVNMRAGRCRSISAPFSSSAFSIVGTSTSTSPPWSPASARATACVLPVPCPPVNRTASRGGTAASPCSARNALSARLAGPRPWRLCGAGALSASSLRPSAGPCRARAGTPPARPRAPPRGALQLPPQRAAAAGARDGGRDVGVQPGQGRVAVGVDRAEVGQLGPGGGRGLGGRWLPAVRRRRRGRHGRRRFPPLPPPAAPPRPCARRPAAACGGPAARAGSPRPRSRRAVAAADLGEPLGQGRDVDRRRADLHGVDPGRAPEPVAHAAGGAVDPVQRGLEGRAVEQPEPFGAQLVAADLARPPLPRRGLRQRRPGPGRRPRALRARRSGPASGRRARPRRPGGRRRSPGWC